MGVCFPRRARRRRPGGGSREGHGTRAPGLGPPGDRRLCLHPAKGRRGRSALRGPDRSWPVRSSVAGASAHRGAAGQVRRALPVMESGHVAPGLVPQDRPARGSGGRGPLLPPGLLGLLLQDPTHNLVLPELLLLLEGAVGKTLAAPRPREARPAGADGGSPEGRPGQRPGTRTSGPAPSPPQASTP